MNIMAGSLGGLLPPLQCERLSVLSIDVNSTCNLRCPYCHLSPEQDSSALTSAQWLMFLRTVFGDLHPDVLCFSGKEVFALQQSAELLFEALRLRDELQQNGAAPTRVGVITNGTLLGQFRRDLEQAALDWIDLSIDGPPAIHDEIRGRGTFGILAANLPWLLRAFGERVWATSTLLSTNVAHLPDMVATMRGKYGVRGFAVGLYHPLAYTDQELDFDDRTRTESIVRGLDALEDLPAMPGTTVVLELDEHEHELQRRLEAGDVVASGDLIRVSERQFGNGITLRIVASDLRVGLWRAVRVTHDGLWLAAEDLVDASKYAERAAARTSELGFDALRLYHAGLASARFRELHGTDAPTLLRSLTRAA